MSNNWRIVFYGETLDGHSVDDTKAKLIQVFNLSSERIDKMFSGVEYVVRKDVPEEKLKQYVKALEKMGLKVYTHAEGLPTDPFATRKANTLATPNVIPAIHASAENVASAALTIAIDENEVKCPRCGFIQPRRTLCRECGLDIPGHWAIEEKNKADLKDREEMFNRLHASEQGLGSVRSSENMYAYNSRSKYEEKQHLYEKEPPPPQLGLNMEGRWGRVSYALSWFSTLLVAFACGILLSIAGAISLFLGLIIGVPLMLCLIAYNIRIVVLRLHDLGLSGWWVVIMMALSAGSAVFWPLSIAYLLFVLYTIFWPGQKQANEYGQPSEMGSLPILVVCILVTLIVTKVGYDKYEAQMEKFLQMEVQEFNDI